eukprot:SAG25_NODE_407_length_8435_cov_46.995082_7_plen_89_part_00
MAAATGRPLASSRRSDSLGWRSYVGRADEMCALGLNLSSHHDSDDEEDGEGAGEPPTPCASPDGLRFPIRFYIMALPRSCSCDAASCD